MNRAALLTLALFVVGVLAAGTFAVRAAVNAVGEATKASVEDRTPRTDDAPTPADSTEPVATSPQAQPEPPFPEAEAPPEDDDPAAAPSAWEPPAFATAEFAVFHHDKRKGDAWRTLQKAARRVGVSVYQGDAPESAKPPFVELRDLPVADYEVITGETLESGRGLSEPEKKKLPATERVTVLDAVMPLEGEPLLAVSKLVAAYAEATGGVLWDEEAHEYLSLEAWKIRRVESWEEKVPFAAMHFTVFTDTTDDGVNLETSGLRHFGLPELRVTSVSRLSVDSAGSLVNALGQTLVEQQRRTPGPLRVELRTLGHQRFREGLEEKCFENAAKTVALSLTPAPGEKRPTLEVVFPGAGGPSERVDAAIAALFGSQDQVNAIEHDAELEALSKRQMREFRRTIRPRFLKGLKPGEVLLVKAPFATASGGTEWMWVEVQRLHPNGKVDGLLANDPDDVPALKSGAKVTVGEAKLFDWMLEEADGTRRGNETGKLMQQRLDAQ